MIRLCTIAFVVSCGLLAQSGLADEAEKKYAFKLSHRNEVGERYQVQMSLHKTFETGEKKKTADVEFSATETIDAIAPGGRPSDIVLELKNYSVDMGEGKQTPLEDVKEIRVKRTAERVDFVVTNNYEPIEGAAREGLRFIFNRIATAEANTDDVAKSSVARKVNETWEGDYDASRNMAESDGVELDPKTHKIIYTLREVKNINGVEHVVITCETTGRVIKLPPSAGLTFKEGEFKASYTAIVPTDKSIKALEVTSESKLEAKFENEAGNEVAQLLEQKKTMFYRQIKDGK